MNNKFCTHLGYNTTSDCTEKCLNGNDDCPKCNPMQNNLIEAFLLDVTKGMPKSKVRARLAEIMENHVSQEAKMVRGMKAWAVCFALNKRCMHGNICTFNKLKEAKKYIVELHKKIGGFEDDHHIVPCEIIYKLKEQNK